MMIMIMVVENSCGNHAQTSFRLFLFNPGVAHAYSLGNGTPRQLLMRFHFLIQFLLCPKSRKAPGSDGRLVRRPKRFLEDTVGCVYGSAIFCLCVYIYIYIFVGFFIRPRGHYSRSAWAKCHAGGRWQCSGRLVASLFPGSHRGWVASGMRL